MDIKERLRAPNRSHRFTNEDPTWIELVDKNHQELLSKAINADRMVKEAEAHREKIVAELFEALGVDVSSKPAIFGYEKNLVHENKKCRIYYTRRISNEYLIKQVELGNLDLNTVLANGKFLISDLEEIYRSQKIRECMDVYADFNYALTSGN